MLAVEHLLAAAEMETGVRGLADSDLLSRVGQLLAWINARGPYTGDQQRAMNRQLQQILAARLRIAGDRRRLPDIAREKVARPIFVIGFPRTGTTLLHSLLAEDPGVLAPRWWHSHEPSPPPGEGPIAAQRLARAARDLDRLIDRTPGLLTLHPYWDKGSDALVEDEELFTLDTWPALDRDCSAAEQPYASASDWVGTCPPSSCPKSAISSSVEFVPCSLHPLLDFQQGC